MKRALWPSLVGATLALFFACGPRHVQPFTPRQRTYTMGDYAASGEDAAPALGSLYTDALAGYLEDTRAIRTGDIVMVRIEEQANASGGASTDLDRQSQRSLGVESLLGIAPAIRRAYPTVDPAQLLSLMSDSGFTGEGQTRRQGSLSGLIAVRVTRSAPNGDLYVEGTKVVMINSEEYHLYVSGLIRPADIDGNNSVPSWRLADAQVEFTGRGAIADQVQRGWLSKFLDFVSPF